MKILRIAALFFVVTLLFCCATVQPVYIGKDTYMIAKGASTWGWDSGSVLKAELYQQADEFCRSKNLHLMPVDSKSSSTSWTKYGSAEVTFRCLRKDDPEYTRPEFQKSRMEIHHD